MANSAQQTRYRQELVAAFEQHQSLLRHTVITDHDPHASGVVFLVAGSGGATAVQKGLDGRIPSRQDDLNQFTCPLAEYHDKPIRGGFNLYTSQGNGKKIMQMSTMAVMNRQCDKIIFDALDTGTLEVDNSASGIALTQAKLQGVIAKLETSVKDTMGVKLWAIISPAFRQKMMGFDAVSSTDYVGDQRFPKMKDMYFTWNGINFIVHRDLPGVGTATAKCYFYANTSVGHAFDKGKLAVNIGYNDEHDYSFARTTAYMGGKLLQNSGVIKFNHDDATVIGTIS